MITIEERFWCKVKIGLEDECWCWTGSKSSTGYGNISTKKNKSPINAHRLSYTINKGKIPDGMVVMHTCDNKLCVNPNHLVIGTKKDNSNDMMAKNRGIGQFKKGNVSHNLGYRKYKYYVNNRPASEIKCDYCGKIIIKRNDMIGKFNYCSRQEAMKHIAIRRTNAIKEMSI